MNPARLSCDRTTRQFGNLLLKGREQGSEAAFEIGRKAWSARFQYCQRRPRNPVWERPHWERRRPRQSPRTLASSAKSKTDDNPVLSMASPGAAQFVRSASWLSARDRTVPRNTTISASALTVIRLASTVALRVRAFSIFVRPDQALAGLSVIVFVTRLTPRKRLAAASTRTRW